MVSGAVPLQDRKEPIVANTQATKQESPYKPGDGLTHATGKKRLGVEGGTCVCGCGDTPVKKRSRFIPGHDARMYAVAKDYKGDNGAEAQKAARARLKKDPRQRAYLKGRNLI